MRLLKLRNIWATQFDDAAFPAVVAASSWPLLGRSLHAVSRVIS